MQPDLVEGGRGLIWIASVPEMFTPPPLHFSLSQRGSKVIFLFGIPSVGTSPAERELRFSSVEKMLLDRR